MDIGKNIKELRLSKMMTQTELAGHEITRNMLSRIENGAALPSLGTVIYLAERLGVPAGLLLAEDGDTFVFLKNNLLNNIKKAFNDNNLELCIDMCNELLNQTDDDEIALIMVEATYRLAENELLNGHLYRSRELLDNAILYSQSTVYNTSTILHCAKNLFYHLRKISPTLDSDNIDSKKHALTSRNIAYSSELCAYLNILDDINNGVYNTAEACDFELNSALFSRHIAAKLAIKKGMYENALEILISAVENEDMIPKFIMYLISADIEICSKEICDYKRAYEYSINKISLLENMLSEG